MPKIKLQFFRDIPDGDTRVGQVYVEDVDDREEAKEKFLRQIREAGVARESEYSFD